MPLRVDLTSRMLDEWVYLSIYESLSVFIIYVDNA
jgi:hypothetical protein